MKYKVVSVCSGEGNVKPLDEYRIWIEGVLTDDSDFKEAVDDEVQTVIKSLAMQYVNSHSAPSFVDLTKATDLPGGYNRSMKEKEAIDVVYSCFVDRDRQTVRMSGHPHGLGGESTCVFAEIVIGKLPEKVVFSGLVEYCGCQENPNTLSFKSTAIAKLREKLGELKEE